MILKSVDSRNTGYHPSPQLPSYKFWFHIKKGLRLLRLWATTGRMQDRSTSQHMSHYTHTQHTVLFALLVAEGGVVLAHQLVAPKIIEPIFGNSMLVWSAVLVCTLTGLSIGYALGDLLAKKPKVPAFLARCMIAAAMTLYATPFLGTIALILSDRLPFILGIFAGTSIVVAPLMILLGTCCPLAVTLLHRHGWEPAHATGGAFATSTLGGILTAIVVAVWALPTIGVQLTCFAAATLLLCTTLLFRSLCNDR